MLLGKKVIAIVGAESTGKTTLAHMVTGRLRTYGVRAALASEAGASLPFDPVVFDTAPEAHEYAAAVTFAAAMAVAARKNVELVIADRTPFDFAAYAMAKHGGAARFVDFTNEQVRSRYDTIYLLPIGEDYVEDGYRAPAVVNTWRGRVDTILRDELEPIVAEGKTMRARHEWVWQHIVATVLGKTKAKRAYEQVEAWFVQRGWRVLAVRPQGSNSLVRFHPASDSDDIDVTLIVDGDANYAIEVREDFMRHKEQLENIVQADLDVLITPKGMESHEV